MSHLSRANRLSAGQEARIAPARIQLHIGRLIIDDFGTEASDALVAALASELEAELGRLFTGNVPVAGMSVRRVAATMTLPARDAGGSSGSAGCYGRAIGATLAGALASQATPPGPLVPGFSSPPAGRPR